MIRKIRDSRSFKLACIALALNLFFELVAPRTSFALTGGPEQPEFGSFTPIGTSDMVNLSSGDMTYNIPLMDVGGYPLNISYDSGVGTDQEATWVGLGWNLSVGQINRSVRGVPDDFDGDEIRYENHMKPNITVGAAFQIQPNVVGTPLEMLSPSVGVSVQANNYTGFSIKPSVGASLDMGNVLSIGFNIESSADGLAVSPSLSASTKGKEIKDANTSLGLKVGTTYNSRAGLSHLSVSGSIRNKRKGDVERKRNGNTETLTDDERGSRSLGLGSSVSFTDQLYTPSKRVGMVTGSFTGNISGGTEIFGLEGNGQITAHGTITKVAPEEEDKLVNAYGYANTENADEYSILDFNREKDGPVSVNTTNLPLTNYTYDIYNVSGQGVSGMYRPYRNQVGYVYDPVVKDYSETGSLGLEFGTGNLVHFGIDFDVTTVFGESGMWQESTSNPIRSKFKDANSSAPDYEKVHYKNVGDLSVDRDWGMFDEVGRYQPVRVNMVGQKFDRRTANQYMQKIAANGNEQAISVSAPIQRTKRQLRNQAIVNVTKGELKNGVGYGPLAGAIESSFPTEAEDHHVNEVQILRNDGARYIYGQPAYNNKKVEATFTVSGGGDCSTGLVPYTHSSLNTPSNLPLDQYLERITTPGYVHTHLLTSILSTDYVDRTGDGPSTDDFGSYTKFTYDQKDDYKWRTPYQGGMASYNEGLKTDDKDNKGNYVYGEKEMYLIKKIETKTHVAIFDYSARKDAKGVSGEQGGLSETQNSYKLDKISLYSIEEYDAQNPSSSTPIKVVHFEYSYSLCTGVPNNNNNQTLSSNELSNFGGKLTLKKIYFTYRNSFMGKYTGYRFNYNEFKNGKDEYNEAVGNLVINNDETGGGTGENPDYNLKAYDSWGNYKPNGGGCGNTEALNAAEFPYTSQNKDDQDLYSAVWHLKKIYLPSGGNISIDYESDDYSNVQNRKTQRMFMVKGAGAAADGSGQSNWDRLYSNGTHRDYLYVEVDNSELTSATHADLKRRYFTDITKPIQFRFLMNMTQQGGTSGQDATAKFDYVSGYFEFDSAKTLSIFEDNSQKYLSIPIKMVKREGGYSFVDETLVEYNPIAKASWQFGRTYLNNHVYSQAPNGDVGGTSSQEDWVLNIMTNLANASLINNLIEVFKGPNGILEDKKIARRFNTNKSWIRLQEPDGTKLGGGSRVKKIRMSDVWEDMNPGQSTYETMQYGQEYIYTVDGTSDGISSGVAAYEPIGNSENPFVQPVFSTVEKLLAPDVVNYTERPFGQSFFPSPTVTYARVQVKNITAGAAPSGSHQLNPLHKTGMVVSEFYTTKDYPTYVDFTHMHAREDKQDVLDNILSLNVRKHFTATQGYSIHINDMNGKQKAQWVYAEGQDAPISGVEYIYDNYETPGGYNASMDSERMKGKLDNFVRVINADGSIQMKTIGVEVDIVNDFRQNSTETITAGVNTNVANFLVGFFPAIVPIFLPDYQSRKDQLRTVSTTKVVNTFGILKETIAYDAGASVKTRNLAWDANTGEVLVTETVDEYNDKYYTFNYPAHWYYRGMGQATQNLGIEGTFTAGTGNYYNVSEFVASQFLIAGDEVYIENSGASASHGWVSSVSGQNITLIDENGSNITSAAGGFKVIRSGRRNLQSAGIMNVTLMKNPLKADNGTWYTSIPTNFLEASEDHEKWKIINAGAVDYSDYWKPDCECGLDLSTGTYNPYVVNERGVWRTKSSRTYLTGRNNQSEVTPRQEGFMMSFSPMYQRLIGGHWTKDFNGWTFVAEVSKYSPYGFELENMDALERYSAAQYGYNHTFPMAVGANTQYREIGFDGFEDYGFDGCDEDAHFNFEGLTNAVQSSDQSHTGKYSMKVGTNKTVTLTKVIDCSQ